MSSPVSPPFEPEIEYPDTDGEPIAENTLQFQWIMTIQGNLDALFARDPMVFVAGDLFWYPVKGDPKIRIAPDTLLVFGRPKGHRLSYKQWEEGSLAPQVVWEVLSLSNRPKEIDFKYDFYEQHGVEEYYVYDPDRCTMEGWLRRDGRFQSIPEMNGFVSPRLGIRFDTSGDELVLYRPDGHRFLTFLELNEQAEAAKQQAEAAKQQAEAAKQQAAAAQRHADEERHEKEQARLQAAEAKKRAEQLAARLRSLGIDPDA